MTKLTNSLTFIRKANKNKDCMAVGEVTADHGIYIHRWATGYQELIMTIEEAAAWAVANKLNGLGDPVNITASIEEMLA